MKKRFITATVLTMCFMAGLIGRIGYLVFGNTYTVSDSYNSYSLTIDSLEPNLYYADGTKLNNNKTEYSVVLRPNEKTVAELGKLFSKDEQQEIIEQLKLGKPIVRNIPSSKKNSTKYIRPVSVTSSDYNSKQLISKQSSGLLYYLPNSVGKKKMNFTIDAKGRILSGDEGRLINDNYDTAEGLKLSLDKQIQNITYRACADMKNGCVIVMNVEDASILACVSKPDNTYLNKPFQQYAVGSVFKVVVAACALENNVNLTYQCKGKITVGDTTYSCYNNNIHSTQTLKTALANSCNCYFVNLALTLGAEKLLATAKQLGFDETTALYDGWEINNACLPSDSDLRSKGELALFGFGQGKLTATPLQFGSLMCTIANGGYKNDTRLVMSAIDHDGNPAKINYHKAERVMTDKTADTLMEYMRYVVSNGTGRRADYNNQSAGKTATAQTGQYKYGQELLNSWFAGVYPYDNPKYAIVIMTEEGTGGSKDCCPIFSTIVENLDKM